MPIHSLLRSPVPRFVLGTLLGTAVLAAGLQASDLLPRVRGVEAKPTPRIGAPTDQIIVRLRDESDAGGATFARRAPMSASRAQAMSAVAQAELKPSHAMSGGAQVMKLERALPLAEVEAIVERLRNDPSVVSAQPDYRRFPLQVNDESYLSQWNLNDAQGGINAPGAWSQGALGSGVVVAVLDTGILQYHPDLGGTGSRIVPGVDLIREDPANPFGTFATANDGDAADPNPTDPGNWISASEAGIGPFRDCPGATESDWHGTHIAGIIAMKGNNGIGGVGIAYRSSVMPVRVLGKCGGYTSDIVDGIRWAAGLDVPRAPFRAPFPAKVINLSLGGPGACSGEEQSAINDAHAAGVVAIVAAAGNDDRAQASSVSPASCTNVIAVAATDRSGSLAPYSNIGPTVALSAPGGCFGSLCPGRGIGDGIFSTFNCGTQQPVPDSACPTNPRPESPYAFVIGTSEASAHVSAVVALMLSVNATLDRPTARTLLLNNTRQFPNVSCTTQICGRGIVDANAAVFAAAFAQGGNVSQPASVADFAVSGEASANSVAAGAAVTYTVRAWSNGPAANSGRVVIGVPRGFTVTGTNCVAAGTAACGGAIARNGMVVTVDGINLTPDAGAATSADVNFVTITVTGTPGAGGNHDFLAWAAPATSSNDRALDNNTTFSPLAVSGGTPPAGTPGGNGSTSGSGSGGTVSGGGGGGSGGCGMMAADGRPDVLLAMLAIIAALGAWRRRRVASRVVTRR